MPKMTDKDNRRYAAKKSFTKNRVDAAGNPIEFRLTKDEWWEIWQASGKYHLYGRRSGEYCMSRYNDIGHYEVGNVFIQLHSDNVSQRTFTPELLAKISAARKGHIKTPEEIAKCLVTKKANGTTGKGRKQSPEHAAKRAAARKANGTDNTGRVWPKEVIAKRSATVRANTEKRRQENKCQL